MIGSYIFIFINVSTIGNNYLDKSNHYISPNAMCLLNDMRDWLKVSSLSLP